MSSANLDAAARTVLQHYPPALGIGELAPLGNHGGFSGASVWRVESAAGPLCLKAWPPLGGSGAFLSTIHDLMARARTDGLEFIPRPLAALGNSFVEHAGRLWDLTTWMPGRADFHDRPSAARMGAACTALARLHQVWAKVSVQREHCHAVSRRLERAYQWESLVLSGWQPRFGHPADPVQPWAERAWQLLSGPLGQTRKQLLPWVQVPVDLQPCLCDVWHNHVLFEGDTVTGLIDFGAAKLDNVATDLARLLGSTAGDDPVLREAGFRAYTAIRPLSMSEIELVTLLDRTGTVLGAANWLLWLYRDHRKFEDRGAVAKRLGELVQRMENWD
jgi:homoserine kinase type II